MPSLLDLKTSDKVSFKDRDEQPSLMNVSPDQIKFLDRQDTSLGSKAMSAMAAFGQGSTAGFSDEIVAGINALQDVTQASLGMRGDIDFSDAYKTHRDAIRRSNKKLEKANPKIYKTAEITGGLLPAVASLGTPAAPASLLKTVGTGLIAGQGYSDAELGSQENLADTALGGAGAGIFYGGAKLGGKLIKGAAEKFAPKVEQLKERFVNWLSDFADERTVKAAVGSAQRKTITDLNRKPGRLKAFADTIRKQEYNDEIFKDGVKVGEQKVPVMGFGSTTEEIGSRAVKKMDEVGKMFDEVTSIVDDTFENAVSGDRIAARMRQYAKNELWPSNYKALYNEVMSQADDIAKMGDISMKRATKLLKSYQYQETNPQTSKILTKDIEKKLRGFVSKEMDETVKMVDELMPGPTGVYDLYSKAKELYGPLKTTIRTGREAQAREIANRILSPSSQGFGAVAAGADAVGKGGFSPMSLLKGAAAGFTNQFLLGRTSSAAAKTADKMVQLLQSNPGQLGRYAVYLQRAATQGSKALGNLHQILMSSDNEYRQLLGADRLPPGQMPTKDNKSLNDAMKRRAGNP